MWISNQLAAKVTATVTCLVYRKSLKVASVNSGNSSNLLSVDPEAIGRALLHIHSMWKYPIIILSPVS